MQGQPSLREFTIPSQADGLPLHARLWSGPEPPLGTLVIAHGLGEHGGCYAHVADVLTAEPGLVDVLAFDFRGHGASPGRRGVVKHYDELLADLRSALDWAQNHRPQAPPYLLGHSNGGQVAVRVALERQDRLSGLVLSNPSFRLKMDVPPLKLWVGKLLRLLAPGLTLHSVLPNEMLSRDPAVHARRDADILRHSRISAPLFFGMVEGGAAATLRASELTLPLMLILGGSDPVIDHRVALEFFERISSADKTLRLDPDAVHEPLNDLGHPELIEALALWLRERLKPASKLSGGQIPA